MCTQQITVYGVTKWHNVGRVGLGELRYCHPAHTCNLSVCGKEQMDLCLLQVAKFSKTVECIGQETIGVIARAGPQAKVIILYMYTQSLLIFLVADATSNHQRSKL